MKNNHLNGTIVMNQWIIYFLERLNPVLLIMTAAGIAVSTTILNSQQFDFLPFMASCVVWFLIGFYLRLDNDLRDCENDRVAYPDRPIPSGKIQRKEAQLVISILHYALISVSIGIFLLFGVWSRIFLLVTVGYFWLMRENFYLGRRLDRMPLVKKIAYQGILIPMTLLSISFSHQAALFTVQNFSYVILLFGSFFTFELCRKLNPGSHPVSQSLIHFFGYKKVFLFAFASLAISGISAYILGVAAYLAPVQSGVLLTLILIFKNPLRYSIAQTAASISLMIHAWSAVFLRF